MLFCIPLIGINAQIGGTSSSSCNEVVGPLFGMNYSGNVIEYSWQNDVSCPNPPCGPPGFIFYDIEIEYGIEWPDGSIVWSFQESVNDYGLISTEPVHSYSFTIAHKSKYVRFRVRVENFSTTCNNPWSNWIIYQFY
ncbi:hypothetical protein [Pseudotenacibaculum haliotis]|uniref:PKD domain-containing protein n=1 Tax=Pseudotenacibaculum haliotis TaxID=1862138 RepID=A0ABW5LV70_9FLAO